MNWGEYEMMKGEEEKKFEKRGGFIPQLGSLSVRTVSHLFWMEYLMTSSGGDRIHHTPIMAREC